MKKIFVLLILTFFSSIVIGQSMTFDNLINTTWISNANWTDKSIKKYKYLDLGKYNDSPFLLDNYATLWTFKDDTLTVIFYDWFEKKTSLVGSYQYAIEEINGKSKMKIIFSDTETNFYEMGNLSTKGFTRLVRDRKKRKE